MTYTDPCTIALQLDKQLMTILNPYVETLVESGYDRKDVETASTMFQRKPFLILFTVVLIRLKKNIMLQFMIS